LFNADGRTDGRADRHDEANIAFRHFATAPGNSATKLTQILLYSLTKYMAVAF